MLRLRSPQYEIESMYLPEEVSFLETPFHGVIGSKYGDKYMIKDNILDCIYKGVASHKVLQYINNNTWLAKRYESTWRTRSIALMTGESYTLEDEYKWFLNHFPIQIDKKYLDAGCSNGLYARWIKEYQPKCDVVAVDYSKEMLKQTKRISIKNKIHLYLIRADLHNMPFLTGYYNGIVMTGTLNELYDPQKVLYEIHRLLEPDGYFFCMYITSISGWKSKFMRSITQLGGTQYWSIKQSNTLFEKANFTLIHDLNISPIRFSVWQAKK